MKNKDIAKIFAISKAEKKTKHLFIDYSAIYSYGYHFIIAEKIGTKIALFNTRNFSKSTTCHKNLVKSALLNNGYTLIERAL
jgi:hypothetical protein